LILFGFNKSIKNIFPPQLTKLLSNNLLFHHLSILFFVYFSIELNDRENNSPLYNFINALIAYLFLILFLKSTLIFSVIIILILISIYFISKEIQYKTLNGENTNYFENVNNILSYIGIGVLVLSNIYYLYKQIKDKGDKFSIYKYIFSLHFPISNNICEEEIELEDITKNNEKRKSRKKFIKNKIKNEFL
jgi:hypothetical protein